MKARWTSTWQDGWGEAKENLKRPSSLWSPRRSACEMICTLIKNDYILIEPFLLVSPSQGEDEAETREYKMGQGPTAGHRQPEPQPMEGNTPWKRGLLF